MVGVIDGSIRLRNMRQAADADATVRHRNRRTQISKIQRPWAVVI